MIKKVKAINNEERLFVKKMTRIQKILDEKSGKNILFWGCGYGMQYILDTCDLSKLNLRFCDLNKTGRIGDRAIEAPNNDVIQWADYIVPTMFYNLSLFNSLMKDYNVSEDCIIRIYNENDSVPINCIEIDLDPEKCEDICNEKEFGLRDKYKEWTVPGLAENYDKEVEVNFFKSVLAPHYIRFFKERYRVLDFGAGSGRLSLIAADMGCDVTAVDINSEMLNIIKSKNNEIETVVVKDYKLPFNDNSFDVIISYDVLIHISDWKDYIIEQSRVLKPGGYMIHGVINDDHLKRLSNRRSVRCSYISGDYKNYMTSVSKKELEEICCKQGLSLERQIPVNFFSKSSFSKGILSRWEMIELGGDIVRMCNNPEFMNVISSFERDIVSRCPADICAYNIAVLRKNLPLCYNV